VRSYDDDVPAHEPPVDDVVATPDGSARPFPWVADAVLALATTLVVVVVAATGDADVGAYGFAIGFGALVLLRRRSPVVMLVLTAGATVGYLLLDYPPQASVLPAMTAVGAATAAGRTRWAVGVGVLLVAAATTVQVVTDAPALGVVVEDLVADLALVAAAVAVGTVVRLTSADRRRTALTLAHHRDDELRAAQLRHQAERLRVAHDLHDVVGHHLSVVALHSSVASQAVGRDDDAARTALRHVQEATAGTLHELRATVQVLRRPDASEPTEPHAARETLPAITGPVGLSLLVAPARTAGLEVNTWVDVPAGSIDAVVDAAAYRIVQESLANVLRHAGAVHAVVRLVVADGRLRVAVSDDGRGAARGAADGAGLASIRERASLLGGSLVAQDRDGGGFAVVADLPTRMSEASLAGSTPRPSPA
jgi:signal transduction histidine kinase